MFGGNLGGSGLRRFYLSSLSNILDKGWLKFVNFRLVITRFTSVVRAFEVEALWYVAFPFWLCLSSSTISSLQMPSSYSFSKESGFIPFRIFAMLGSTFLTTIQTWYFSEGLSFSRDSLFLHLIRKSANVSPYLSFVIFKSRGETSRLKLYA